MAWGEYKLTELKLDQRNVRTGPTSTQREAVEKLLENQTYRLVALADDLVKVGPSPGEPIWVTPDPDEPGKQIVLEGNRRLAAFKLLENPELAAGTLYAKAFADMAKDFAKAPRRVLEARIFDSRANAQQWIDRRHMPETSGVGLQKWGSLEVRKVRRERGGSTPRSLAALEYLDDGSREFAAAANTINAKATTVDRVLNNPALREVLGIDIDRKSGAVTFGNGDETAGRQLLSDIITTLAEPDFRFGEIHGPEGRARLLDGFRDRSVAAAPKASPKKPEAKDVGATKDSDPEPPKSRRARPAHAARATLAPKSGDLLQVTGKRLNPLYDECRNIIVADHKNASALLLRVFLELATETLLTRRKVALPKGMTDRNKKGWDDFGVKLSWKIEACCNYLDPGKTRSC